MDYEQMEIDITLESDRDLKENMQATAKFALGQIMEYQHPTKVKNRHEGYGIAAEGYASLQGKMKSTKTDMDDLLKLLPNGDGDVLNVIGSLYNSAVEVAVESIKLAAASKTGNLDALKTSFAATAETCKACHDAFRNK